MAEDIGPKDGYPEMIGHGGAVRSDVVRHCLNAPFLSKSCQGVRAGFQHSLGKP